MKLPKEIRAKLIAYANCNRCELTPDEARQIVVADDLRPEEAKHDLERKIIAAAMARCEEWLLEYPEGLRAPEDHGVPLGPRRDLIEACLAFRALRVPQARSDFDPADDYGREK